jgi:2,4-diketo-3-deoxy-L-fuconate hydrolase
MRIAKWIIASLAVVLAVLFLYTWKLSQPIFDEKQNEQTLLAKIQTAPIDQALTFARLQTGEVMLVFSADSLGVKGIDLGATSGRSFVDSVDAYHQLGGTQLRALATDQQSQAQLYKWEQLGIPVNETYPHIAAGTNYRAHAEEVGHVGDPFVFPKFSRITRWNASVNEGARLDYEVELCAVPLKDHSAHSPAQFAYILCGDYTDRWLLVKEMDLAGPMGPTGFPAGKGGETRFPVGNLLVIPEADDFYKDIELTLYLNGKLRQRSSAGLMIWSPRKALNKALDDCQVPYFRGGKETVVTPSCEKVPARTLLLTGTPAGVMFNIATLWNPFFYLGSGDEVISSGTYLGLIRNRIKGSEE